MLFNSLHFLIFLPIVLLVYFLIPRKMRYIFLLLASYYFYMCWNVKYVLLLVLSTVVTYAGSLLLVRQKENKTARKWIVAGELLINFGILFTFKYFNFTWEIFAKVGEKLHLSMGASPFSLLLPVGISFYIFQAVGYTIDVYRDQIVPEKNFFRYALFVSFFPQLVAGPIERSKNLLPKIQNLENIKLWDRERIEKGAIIMLYGFFLKMMIADRCAIFVDTIFDVNQYNTYKGLTALIGAVLFSVQIYCDFAGYSLIALGSARIMGIELMHNFQMPYFATSIKDFWDRWHISLSTWFRDYLYFPLGGSRKGKIRKYVNIMIVFAVSGLWHGAAIHFVVWGILHGMMRVLEELTTALRKKLYNFCNINTKTFSFRLGQGIITFFLVTFAWVFFRAESLRQAVDLLKNMFTWNPWVLTDDSLLKLGLDGKDWNILLVSLLILLTVSILRQCKLGLTQIFLRQNFLFRLLVFYIGIFAIVIFGVYGMDYDATQFIYFQF